MLNWEVRTEKCTEIIKKHGNVATTTSVQQNVNLKKVPTLLNMVKALEIVSKSRKCNPYIFLASKTIVLGNDGHNTRSTTMLPHVDQSGYRAVLIHSVTQMKSRFKPATNHQIGEKLRLGLPILHIV